MSTPSARPPAAILQSTSRTLGIVAALVGGMALLGWAVDLEFLKSLRPGAVAMNPATALTFILAGASLWLLSPGVLTSRSRPAAQGSALVVALLGFVHLCGYGFGWEGGLDKLLFHSRLGDNQMAPNTAVHFLLLGLSLWLIDSRSRRGLWLAQSLALAAAAGSVLALTGYAFETRALYGIPNYIPMALNTAAAFCALAVGVLCARPGHGIMRSLTSDGTGGVMARRLLPVAIGVPVVVGWLRLQGELAGLYDTEFGVSLIVVCSMFMFLAAIWWTARALDQTDAERRSAQEELRQMHRELEQRVQERTEQLAQTNQALEAEIVERNRAEGEVRRLNADLQHQLHQLASANWQLAQQSRENETFVYSVSHDLRSPLVNLQGFSKELGLVCRDIRTILVENELPPAVRKHGLELVDVEMMDSIRFIQTAVMRLSGIIDALLRLSRAGRIEYKPQPTDVQRIVRRVVEAMSGTVAERDATVTVKDLPTVWGDPIAVEQVFANLIGNALNYLDPARPGVVEIGCAGANNGRETEEDAGFHRYYVKDNGLGIAEAYQSKVFEAFQRLHPDAAKGEGMGLAIVRRMVERHGGKIWVESRSGAGSTFFVELPAPDHASPAPDRDSFTVTAEERSRENGKRTVSHCVGGR